MTAMDAHAQDPRDLVERFLSLQRSMYAGGAVEMVAEMLADDVIWHVPGWSPIAGDYHGRDAVTSYFAIRRDLAGGSIVITKHGDVAGSDVLVQLADGHATLGDDGWDWRTAGVYRVADGRIAEAWLVPLDQERFDRAWERTRAAPFVYTQRVRPQDCATSTALGHPRFLEFFEAAFIECWRDRHGHLGDILGSDRRVTVAAVEVNYLVPVGVDDELRVEVAIDRITRRSIQLHYNALVDHQRVARARARYVYVDGTNGGLRPESGA